MEFFFKSRNSDLFGQLIRFATTVKRPVCQFRPTLSVGCHRNALTAIAKNISCNSDDLNFR